MVCSDKIIFLTLLVSSLKIHTTGVLSIEDLGYHAGVVGATFCSGALIYNDRAYYVATPSVCVEDAFEVRVVLGTENIIFQTPINNFSPLSYTANGFDVNKTINENVAFIKLPANINLRDFSQVVALALPDHSIVSAICEDVTFSHWKNSDSTIKMFKGNLSSLQLSVGDGDSGGTGDLSVCGDIVQDDIRDCGSPYVGRDGNGHRFLAALDACQDNPHVVMDIFNWVSYINGLD